MKKFMVLAGVSLLAIVGCSGQIEETTLPNVSVDRQLYLLDSEPEGAKNVIAVREEAADEDDVVILGRIGGSANPWVDGMTAFSIVDPSLKACSDIPGNECAKPWDYCCKTDKLPGATALVKVVDKNGEMIPADAKSALDLKELQTVVIRGKAERDEDGNLTVVANQLYVRE